MQKINNEEVNVKTEVIFFRFAKLCSVTIDKPL